MLPSYFDLKMTSTHLKAFAFAVCAATLLPACGPSAGKSAALDLIGATLPHADGTHYVVENNSAGAASNMTLLSVSWGRLIDEVFDAAGT